ncbi:MAG: hypothetical protein KC493_06865 [Bacteriovoracaceae bacterium]|nr:hypothetical protein [Bacteriovoracaceae bacterium]
MKMILSEQLKGRVLVHAVGNETRSDDALGLMALEIVKAHYPNFTFKENYQLYFEDVLEWVEFDTVWFLDASHSRTMITRDFKPVPVTFNPSVHHLEPDLLASMASEIYKKNVKVIITELPGEDFSLGSELSPQAKIVLQDFESSISESNFPVHLK